NMRALILMSVLGLGTLLVQAARAADPPSSPSEPVRIQMQVPADAEVWFDGAKTQQTGSERAFISPPLRPGRQYVYQVHVRWSKGGQPVADPRPPPVRPGHTARLDFGPRGDRPSFYAGPSSASAPAVPTSTYPVFGGSDFAPSFSPNYDWGRVPLT